VIIVPHKNAIKNPQNVPWGVNHDYLKIVLILQ
jgi:hypothetical protein